MWWFSFYVRHRIDGLETPLRIILLNISVRHRIDGLESQRHTGKKALVVAY